MRFLITIIFILLIKIGFAQKLVLPEKPYILVIGKDTLITQTIIETAPDLSGLMTSGNNLSDIRLNLKIKDDTVGHKPIYANGDSLRVWTYLFKDEKYTINFPKRIDTVTGIDLFTGNQSLQIDTTDHIEINKLIDTLTIAELNKLLDTEIEVFYGRKKLKVRRISVLFIWPSGETYGTNYEETKIGNYPTIKKAIKTISPNGYIVLNQIWFYDEKRKQNGISGKIGWKIK